MFPKQKAFRSRKLLDSSRGQNCTLNFDGCQNDVATVVAAHSNQIRHGKAGKRKSDDVWSCDACGWCHDIYDCRRESKLSRTEKEWAWDAAHIRTTNRRLADGSLKT